MRSTFLSSHTLSTSGNQSAVWTLLLTNVALPIALGAQVSPMTNLIYYTIENQNAKRVEQHGTTGSTKTAFDRLILKSNTRYRIWLLEAATLHIADVEVTTR